MNKNETHPLVTAKDILELFQVRKDGVFCGIPSFKTPIPVITNNPIGLIENHIGGYSAEDGYFVCKQFKNGKPLSKNINCLGVGVYTVSPEGKSKTLCIDIDSGTGHKKQVLNIQGVIKRIVKKAKALGLTIYLEKSKNSSGWHLWVFFNKPENSFQVRELGKALLPQKIKIYHTDNDQIEEIEGFKGVEVFPKQGQISEFGVGNQVTLPFWKGAKKGGGQFYDLNLFVNKGLEQQILLEEVSFSILSKKILTQYKPIKRKYISRESESETFQRGSFLNILERCNALRKIWDSESPTHMERVALLAFARNTKDGETLILERWNSDKTSQFIKYANNRNERPWSCSSLQDYGLCDRDLDPIFNGNCLPIRFNKDGEATRPSPIRFAKRKEKI